MLETKGKLPPDEIKRELQAPMIPLTELISYDNWFNIPSCVMTTMKHLQQYILDQDKVLKFLNDKIKSTMIHQEAQHIKLSI